MPIRRDVAPEQLDPSLLKHLHRLRISGVKQYRQWCVDRGFSPGLNKHRSLREVEIEALTAPRSKSVDRQREEQRRPAETLLAIVFGALHHNKIHHPAFRHFANCVRTATRSKHRPFYRDSTTTDPALKRDVLVELLQQLLERRAKFLGKSCLAKKEDVDNERRLEALVRISQYRRHWVRPLEDWTPRSRSAGRQFKSLIRHLFDRYGDVPAFMDAAWLPADQQAAAGYRQWYVQLGAGKNLRHCDLPVPYTKRMAHWFSRCPDGQSIAQAIRYGQVMGLGGDEQTALAINGTRLAEHFVDDEFWITFMRWVIDHPMLDRAHVGPIADYIHFQRFVPEHVVVRDQQGAFVEQDAEPREPNFSMKGRTPETLLRQVNRWHGRLRNSNAVQVCSWTPSYIQPFSLLEGVQAKDSGNANSNFKRWTIRELLSSASLLAEGRQLNHCVASYARSCASGHSSIWTMELEGRSGVSKLLTVEVCLKSRTIVQVRGTRNRLPTQQEVGIIQRWAADASLKVTAYGVGPLV